MYFIVQHDDPLGGKLPFQRDYLLLLLLYYVRFSNKLLETQPMQAVVRSEKSDCVDLRLTTWPHAQRAGKTNHRIRKRYSG